ncbi:hypothetical protein VTJ04DRAFT_4957 [Mycothermus thermophilus]|uniref:uncharacterized protein n=1 Tax=Humicola insolens TaxID=85995 RepID=UPI0037427619
MTGCGSRYCEESWFLDKCAAEVVALEEVGVQSAWQPLGLKIGWGWESGAAHTTDHCIDFLSCFLVSQRSTTKPICSETNQSLTSGLPAANTPACMV